MKDAFILVALMVCGLSLCGQSKTIEIVDIDLQEVSLAEIIKELEALTEYNFSYGNLKEKRKASFTYSGPSEQTIQAFCEQERLAYKIIGQQIVLKDKPLLGQVIKGKVIDADSDYHLIGATVMVIGSDPLIGTVTDEKGEFRLPRLEVGRYDLSIEYLGYEPTAVHQVQVTTGKQVYLTIPVQESLNQLLEVVITHRQDLKKPLNDMASSSARSFSLEETSRYAASINDPARMALSFAGVTGSGDDGSNEIIVRGNTSRGLLWRLEGIEIPNPNHFSVLGSGGGAISMLSASTLATSDFYTGAFPAEYGNAISGVFDLKMRNGNNTKREHSIQSGLIGLSASSEGPFSKKSKATYLINYRYSTLDLLMKIIPLDGLDELRFQDLSYKVNIPIGPKSALSTFGLLGNNAQLASGSSSQDQVFQKMGIIGVQHKSFFSERINLTNTIAYSYWGSRGEMSISGSNPRVTEQTDLNDKRITLSTKFNYKFDKSNSLRMGANLRFSSYKLKFEAEDQEPLLEAVLDNNGNANLYDSYVQWKHRYSDRFHSVVGINASYFSLNKALSIDPRMSFEYQINEKSNLSLSLGFYSKPDHPSTYLLHDIDDAGPIANPNLNLPMTTSVQVVLGYNKNITEKFRFKTELYYQHLYNVPVGTGDGNTFSILNARDIFDVVFENNFGKSILSPSGTGTNYGIDITLEKFFSRGYYFLVTGSLFDAKYTTNSGQKFRTRYANNYVANFLGGKEWKVGRSKQNIFGLNLKLNNIGGIRQTPILLFESRLSGMEVLDTDNINASRLGGYRRIDVGIFLKRNKKKSTHTFRIDIQNLTNRRNQESFFYSQNLARIVTRRQNGMIPFASYRVEF